MALIRNGKPNLIRGGRLNQLTPDIWILKGKTHEQGGIDIGNDNDKNNIEAENGELVKLNPITGTMDILSNSLKYGNKTLSNIAKTGNPVEIENKFDRLFYMQEMSKKGKNKYNKNNMNKINNFMLEKLIIPNILNNLIL